MRTLNLISDFSHFLSWLFMPCLESQTFLDASLSHHLDFAKKL